MEPTLIFSYPNTEVFHEPGGLIVVTTSPYCMFDHNGSVAWEQLEPASQKHPYGKRRAFIKAGSRFIVS